MDVLQLVPQDRGVFLIILPAHHDLASPAEGGDVEVHQRQAAALAGLRGAASDDFARPRNRDQAQHQHSGHAGRVEREEPGEGGSGLAGLFRDHPEFADLDAGEVRDDDGAQAQQRQQVADQRAGEQHDAVEAEEGSLPHDQQVEGIEDGQVQAGARNIKEGRCHFCLFSMVAISAFSSSRSILSSSTNWDTSMA